jgi:type IV pilus assembly protein PilY1
MNGLKFNIAIQAALVVLIAGINGPSVADDTEIFSASPSLAASISAPNVLIILDNTSNWGNGANPQPFNDEKAALKTVVGALKNFNVNVGLMFQAAGDTDGGYVRFAVRPMSDGSGNATVANTKLGELVEGLDAGNDKANNPTYAQTLAEAYYYLKGGVPRAGFGDIHRDCGTVNINNPYSSVLSNFGYTSCGTANPANKNQFTDPAYNENVLYRSPLSTTDPCQKTYIIYISNGPISNNDGQTEAADNNPGYVLLRNAGATSGQLATIAASPNAETRVNYSDEWTSFLFQSDLSPTLEGKQNVISYTINVRPGTTGQGPAHTAMMNSMAINGGGRPFTAVTQADIEEALLAIFNEIQNVNSVFAAVSLPVSVNVRGINANQVYVGMFRPDPDSLPRWPGNLKLYQLGVYNGNLVLTDQRTTDPANVNPDYLSVNNATGQFYDQAVSFWTQPSTFWGFNTTIGPASSSTPASDSPDGSVVEKGGVAEGLRTDYASSQAARKVFTCIGCTTTTNLVTGTNNTDFSSSNSNMSGTTIQSNFGVSSAAELTNLINWVRGEDNAISPGGENNNGVLTDVRASIHSDVLHSRPIVINYGGDTSDNDVVIFYGSNDGMLRAVKGGYAASSGTAATSGIAAGKELWSFVAPEFFPRFVRQRDNSPAVTSASGLSTQIFTTTITNGSANVLGLTTTQTDKLARGMSVSGSGIPGDTFVVGVGANSVTLTRNATSSNASATLTFTPNPKDYFFDGPIGVFVQDVSSTGLTGDGRLDGTCFGAVCDQVMLFVSMRRGGRMLYAFDVTNPSAPKFKWKVGCPNLSDNIGCTSTDFNGLGQTWSEPKVVKVRIGSADRYVVIMGAGYDPAVEDLDPIATTATRTLGKGVYVLDYSNGSVLWRATPSSDGNYSYTSTLASVPGMDYAIPSDVMVIDRDKNGYADRAYVGDTGGNVWRIDMADTNLANWRVNKLASVGRAQYLSNSTKLAPPTAGEDNSLDGNTRKFLYAPDVVPGAGFDAVLIGSGDREHPFNGYGDSKHPISQAVHNRYYMFKDADVSSTYACNNALGGTYSTATYKCSGDAVLHEMLDATTTQLFNSTNPSATDVATILPTMKGWYIDLGLGEKLTGSSVTLGGSTFFNTNIPTPPQPGVCSSNLGEARQYAVNYLTGGAAFDRPADNNTSVDFVGDRYAFISSGGFLPSPVGLIVKIGGELYQGIASGPNIQNPGGLKIGDRIKAYWRKRID